MGFYNFADGIWGCGFQHAHASPRRQRRLHQPFRLRHVRHRRQRGAHRLQPRRLDRPGTRGLDGRVPRLRARACRAPARSGSSWRRRGIPAGLVRAFERRARARHPDRRAEGRAAPSSRRGSRSRTPARSRAQDAVYDAIFDRYGVHRARDMDELATTLILFAQPHRGRRRRAGVDPRFRRRAPAPDRPRRTMHGVPLTQLSPASTAKLESLLDPGLPAVNPLDAWSTGGPDYHVTHAAMLCYADERSAGRARRRRARPRRGRRHPCGLPRLPARGPSRLAASRRSWSPIGRARERTP